MSASDRLRLTNSYTIQIDQGTGQLETPIKVGGHLTINDIKFGDAKMTPFMTAIQSISTLTTIQLQRPQKTADTSEFTAYFDGTDSTVTTLTLRRCSILSESDHALADFLEKIPAVARLLLMFNLSEPDNSRAIAHTLRTNTTLTALEILSEVADTGCVLEALKANSTLTSFALRDNIEDDGMESIVAILISNSNITSLDLSNNNIGPDGVEHLARALAISPSLTHLDLSHNSLEYNGCGFIASALNTNTNLVSLVLSNTLNGTPFGFDGVSSIIKALATNTTLTHLDMSHNLLTGNAYGELELLKKNATLTSLNISATHVDHWGFEKLFKTAENNLSLTVLDLSLNEEKKNEGGYLAKLTQILDKNTLSEKNRHTDLFSLVLSACKDYL